MHIQIFGSAKCAASRKAERFFKERNISFQKVELHQKGFSKGELESVKAVLGISAMVNETSKEYKTLQFGCIRNESVKMDLLLANPRLLKTPIVRNGKKATVGYQADIWQAWIEA